MIKLPDGYVIVTDENSSNIILGKSYTDKKGNERVNAHGYYTSLPEALNGWRKRAVNGVIARKDITTIKDAIAEIKRLDEHIEALFKEGL